MPRFHVSGGGLLSHIGNLALYFGKFASNLAKLASRFRVGSGEFLSAIRKLASYFGERGSKLASRFRVPHSVFAAHRFKELFEHLVSHRGIVLR